MNTIKKVMLIHKVNSPAQNLGRELILWLGKKGIGAKLFSAEIDSELLQHEASYSDLIIILGGDGTLIGTARRLNNIVAPIVGINFGKTGFLAEIPNTHWEQPLEQILDDSWTVEAHLKISWKILHVEGKKQVILKEGIAINDVVTAHGIVARAVELRTSIDGVSLGNLRGDGIIAATPLGSTAYTVSAGGPLALPSMNALLITPICPFDGAFPPLVLPSSSSIQIEPCRKGDQVILSVDGQEDHPLSYGDILQITACPHNLYMLVGDRQWYMRRLISRGIIKENI